MSNYNGVEIAIVGMSGQFPGAATISEFWENLKNGVESIRFFSEEEILEEGEDPELVRNPAYVKANACLDNKEFFDAAFFGYTPAEAALMDPQIRLFHENCWKALEDAGCDVTTNTHKIGLFAGGSSNINWLNYSLLANQDNQVGNFAAFQLRDITFLCSRVSHLLNLQGPSIYLNTACSTSLVAVQRACMSLLLRECRMALAGGITVHNYSKKGYLYEEGMIDSKDGHCRAFDAAATGTIGGEGVGVVVLKRLEDALADGDHIYCIIRGSGINNDGADKIAYTAPCIDGQSQAIVKAISMAGVKAESISYVEAHGTATSIGDPIEVEALLQAYGKSNDKYCAIGSVKSNVGHLDIAAGVAGLIKTALSLQHRMLLPSLHFTSPNPKISFANSPFYVNTQLQEWKNNKYPLRAGVSSFGIGGTNAHLVLEEAPALPATSAGREARVFVFSAKSPAALERNMQRFGAFMAENTQLNLSDAAFTLQTGRAAMPFRKAIAGKSTADVAQRLQNIQLLVNNLHPVKGKPEVAFLFSGQGAQYAGMCRGLYAAEPVFKNAADHCFAIVQKQTGKDLAAIFLAEEEAIANQVHETAFTQPLLFIVEYALNSLLNSWGIQPDVMIGHSIGEYTAACISGLFSLEDALMLVVKRGALMQSAEKGSMLSISLAEKDVLPLLSNFPNISLAAVNSTESCVVAGDKVTISAFEAQLAQQGIACKMVKTSHAFHSHMMDGILAGFEQAFAQVTFGTPRIPFISNLSGKLAVEAEVRQPAYWVKHLRNTVRFAEGVATLCNRQQILFVEVGPGNILSAQVRANHGHLRTQAVINVCRHAKAVADDQEVVLQALGEVWANGIIPDWKNFYQNETRRKISVPTYSFDRVTYPVHVDAFKLITTTLGGVATARSFNDWFYMPGWKKSARLFTPAVKAGASTVLLVHAGDAAGLALEAALAQQGNKVTQVYAGSTRDAYERLFRQQAAARSLPDTIVFCSTGDALPGAGENQLAQGLFGLLHLVQALHTAGNVSDKKIVLLTNELHIISGNETVVPENAMAGGLLKIIAQEYPGVVTRHIDMSIADGGAGKYMTALCNEINAAENDRTVALRNTQRWVPCFDNLLYTTKANDTSFKHHGTYFITGGLGNLGYTIASYLLSMYQANIVLLGRTPLSAKEQWQSLPDNSGTAAALKNRLEKLQLLAGKGGQVLYLDGDVASVPALTKVIEESEKVFGNIDGVIHAAGLVSGETINPVHLLSAADFEQQLNAKMEGVKTLAAVLANKPLDFCLVASSVSAVLGGLGFGAYAAANTFMDYFIQAHRNNASLENWISVNFDGFDFTASANGKYIHPGEVPAVLEQAVALKSLPQLVISKTSLQKRIDEWLNSASQDDDATTENEAVASFSEDDVEGVLLQVWRSFFGKEWITATDDFFEAGGDSLKALTLIKRIQKRFQVDISIKEFFNRTTVAALAVYIRSLLDAGKRGTTADHAIPTAAATEYYPLSSAQQRLYFQYEFDKTSLAYNLPQVLELEGAIDTAHLENVFTRLLARHESLRTSFVVSGNTVVQQIAEKAAFKIEHLQAGNPDAIIKAFIRPFNLSQAPLIRVGLSPLGTGRHLLLIDIHHIITDGVSADVLAADFMALYNQEVLPPLQVQYKDYAVWQQSDAHQQQLLLQKKFWTKVFEQEAPVIELPTDYARPSVQSHAGSSLLFELNQHETDALKALAEQEGVTLFMLLLSAYAIFLGKIANQEDIVIGTPVAGRQHADLERIIGIFLNTLPVRVYPSGDLSCKAFIAAVKEQSLACFDNQDYPYETLIDELKVKRDMSHNPLFDVMFAYQNFSETKISIPGLSLSVYNTAGKGLLSGAQFDLLLSAVEAEGRMVCSFEYATALFNSDTVQRFEQYFRSIIASLITDVNQTIASVALMDKAEADEVIGFFNHTEAAYPADKTLVDIFEAQVKQTPDHTAVCFENRKMTYRELDEKAGAVASYLQQQQGIGRGDLVGIMLEREWMLMPVIYGILKAGAAYVPIDPHNPAARIAAIAEEAGLQALVTRKAFLQELPEVATTVVNLDSIENNLPAKAVINRQQRAQANDLAYVIFTSGSTGKPKGVMIEHHAVINRLLWMQKSYPLQATDVILQKTPVTFDVSVWELFWWAFTGASVCLLKPGGEKDPDEIISTIAANKITTLHFVPSMLSVFLAAIDNDDCSRLSSLRQVFASGEALKAEQARWFGRTIHKHCQTALINLYGPTEATVDVSYYNCSFDEEKSIPIGKPIDNIRLYVVTRHQQLAPIGVAGELCIAGVGLARGYLNNPALTESRFINHSFINGERIYKTGDWVRWLPDGNIEYLGRIDHQVKIRGLRIELGEIESWLDKYPGMKEACVAVQDYAGDKCLVAYYIADEPVAATAFRSFLQEKLPEYMVPGFYVPLQQFPLSANGKLDRKALPLPELTANEAVAVPANETEERLAQLWSEVLHVDKNRLSTTDDFFLSGGHSIRAIHLINAIYNAFSVKVELRSLFENTTIQAQALLVNKAGDNAFQPIPVLPYQDRYVCSSAQERMFYEYLQHPESVVYNISGAFALEGDFDKARFAHAFRLLVQRHEALRTTFSLTGNGVMQQINEEVTATPEYLHASAGNSIEGAISSFIRPFDLAQSPLMRMALLEHETEGLFLLVDVHHMVCDGISLNILIRDFNNLYNGVPMEPVALRYIDYAAWEKSLSQQLTSQKAYWLQQLSGELVSLDLPRIQPKAAVVIQEAAIVELLVEQEVYASLKAFATSANVTEFMFLLTLYYILIARLSGNTDIIIGSDAVGRTHPALQNVVGTFINILPLRVQLLPDMRFDELLKAVKETVLGAYENQAFPVDEMMNTIHAADLAPGQSLVEVHFAFSNFIDNQAAIDNVRFRPVAVPDTFTTQYECKLEAFAENDRLIVEFIYSIDLYDEETVTAMAGYFRNILIAVLANPAVILEEINIEAFAEALS